ncbi:hypothetical protein [Streptomyces fodineus]|uniref:hypothetical protein n=1 Tax=Streptomyces fodineus TaxID=1904616 RepID=UPI0013EA0EA7|nr:hypothetical protein [Streptomyces fodineus]
MAEQAWFSQPLPEVASVGSQPLPVTAVQVAVTVAAYEVVVPRMARGSASPCRRT